jgi:phosphate-selective porin
MKMSKGLVILAGVAAGLSGVSVASANTNDETKAIVAQMLADAETRSSLLSAGDAGHDGKFFIAGDGFRLNVGGMLQFRYNLNFRDDTNTDDFQSGFQNARVKLDFNGKINRDWDFRILTNISDFSVGQFDDGDFGSSSSSGTGLEDAWVRYNFPNGWKLRWGQFKLPGLREELVSDSHQLAAERSLANQAFSQAWSQGVELAYEAESWRMAVAFSDGLNSSNTDFAGNPTNPSAENTGIFRVSGEADWAISARGEFLFAGNWAQFKDFTSPKGSDFGAMLGVAGHFQQSENTNNPGDLDRDTFQYTADISLKGDSWNLFGAFIGRYTELSTLSAETDFHDFGAVIQGGWRFAENTELFARWDGLFFDSDRNLSEDNFNFITGGINHYFAGHAAKFTADVVYAFEETNVLNSLGILQDTGVGLLGDSEDGEIVIRGQFQLLF